MFSKQSIVTLDLEGVLIPEIWIAFAEKTGIEKLKLTTRDITDYDELMMGRLKILEENNLTFSAIQNVISTLSPLDGAKEFIQELRSITQVIILSDTFQEFAWPLMKQLDFPTLFCHNLKIENDKIVGYELRQHDQKKKAVAALKTLNYNILSAGDSYNDTSMLLEADQGILFKAPQKVIDEFPQFKSTNDYNILLKMIKDWIASI